MENNEEYGPYEILADYLVNGKPAEMPDEVWVVLNWPYQLVSFETQQKLDAVKIKYPEYFPWEAKYREIPQDVHDAYFKALHPSGLLFGEFLTTDDNSYDCSPGMAALIDEAGQWESYSPKDFTMDDFVKVCQNHQENQQLEFKQADADRRLWDKYYKPFNLPYRP